MYEKWLFAIDCAHCWIKYCVYGVSHLQPSNELNLSRVFLKTKILLFGVGSLTTPRQNTRLTPA